MKFRILLLPILFCLCFHINASAENEEPIGIYTENGFTRFISLGGGPVYQSFRDEAISKSIYEGLSASPVLKFVKMRENTLSELSLQASLMSFKRDSDPLLEQKIKTWRAVADYRYMQTLPLFLEEEKNKLYVGGQLSGMFCHKYAPKLAGSASVYEYAVTLGPSARFTKKFEAKDKFHSLSVDVSVPVLNYTARPSYLNRTSSLEKDKVSAGDVFSKGRMSSFGRMFRLNTGISYMYMLENGNAINIAYNWDYYHINNETEVYFASHTLSLLFMFNY